MLLKSFGLAGRLFHVSIVRREKKYLATPWTSLSPFISVLSHAD